MCIEGKDEVYFQDSCGNAGNIYDASKITDKAYWRKVVQKKDSCGAGNTNGNSNSPSCGNCDYFSGSFCRKYDKSKDTKKPTSGDFTCRDLNCKNTQDGKDYKHGESWCIYDDGTGKGKDPAGSRYWKHICIAGEELVEPCGDFRSEICIQDVIETPTGPFQQAGCAPNQWQDCYAQKTQKDCENIDKRDCQWITGAIGTNILLMRNQTQQTGLGGVAIPSNSISTNPAITTTNTGGGITGKAVGVTGNAGLLGSGDEEKKDTSTETLKGEVCVPDVPPGLVFWKAGEAEGICSMGNAQCTIEYEKAGFIGGSKKCVKNCECEGDAWKKKNEEICRAIGDCTGSEGVYKYLQQESFVSGTSRFFMPFLDYMLGIAEAKANSEFIQAGNKSINKGIINNYLNIKNQETD
jgi:hypothetical protein